ncbi:MAG: aminodeoxychorismate/anthranilate synthase component II [Flavobacteriales bacterium]|nr:aminodeoxychorismate/anthranilate synthase component II [Flavobacteriales bacterium]
MNILVIDNYDSFTYNLVQYVKDVSDYTVAVKRNDEITLDEVEAFDKILISPGPGVPEDAGITKSLIARYGKTKSILGVCLGMQAIAEVYGGKIENLTEVYHGVASTMNISHSDSIFHDVPTETEVGRYHSWAVSNNSIPRELEVLAHTSDNCIMAIRHKEYDVKGVQFHPESVLTPYGKQMIKNWVFALPSSKG